MTEDKITISKSKLEKIIEQKVDQRLQEKEKTETRIKDKNNSEKLDRRQFIKKAGLGTAGLAALGIAPASALNINTDELSVNTGSDSGNLTENLAVDTDGNVEIPNGRFKMTGDTTGIQLDRTSHSSVNEVFQMAVGGTGNGNIRFRNESTGLDLMKWLDDGDIEIPNGDLDVGENALDIGSFRFRVDQDTLIIEDDEVELIRQDEQGTTQFIQGIDAGPVEAPEDTFSQIINTPVTSDTDSGTTVGHTFSVNNQTAIAIKAETDGNGGIQSLEYEFHDSSGNLTMRINNDGSIDTSGSINEGSL